MTAALTDLHTVFSPTPTAHFGLGALASLPEVVAGTGGDAVVIVTDAALAATPVIAAVTGVLDAGGLPVTLFTGVHPNPTTDDIAAGAAEAASLAATGARVTVVAVGGGSPIDAARGSRWPRSTPSAAATSTTAGASRTGRCRWWRCRPPRAPGRRPTRSAW